MTRIGWTFLILAVIVIGGFLSMLRVGGAAPSAPGSSAPGPAAAPQPAASPIAVRATGHPGLPRLIVPVEGVSPDRLSDDWGDPREDGRRLHHGIDIPAPEGTPVIAAAPGTIEKLFHSDKGGTTLYERSPDGQWQYYYAHLSGYAAGVHEGQRVDAGDTLAYVGDSGDAPAGVFHLHFGLSFMRPGDGWWQGQAVNPYPLLARTVPDR
ncbi:M23 family metallopeptidase [Hephaestia mangrovi]|uniref:M23 family metallopeptidase n=1 Tax=Hephaestia mangrovi TaxID=2873268 RepID=UPI001CA6DB0E|nr:M23 family metallopeptidase [Hephaestia mangrovi]